MSVFKYTTVTETKVYLDDKLAGSIKEVNGGPGFKLSPNPGGFAYFPKGSKSHGDVFPSLAEVKRSIEE